MQSGFLNKERKDLAARKSEALEVNIEKGIFGSEAKVDKEEMIKAVLKRRTVKLCRYGQSCWRPDCHFGHDDCGSRAQRWAAEWRSQVCESHGRGGGNDAHDAHAEQPVGPALASADELKKLLDDKHTDIEDSIKKLKSEKTKVAKFGEVEAKLNGVEATVIGHGMMKGRIEDIESNIECLEQQFAEIADVAEDMKDMCAIATKASLQQNALDEKLKSLVRNFEEQLEKSFRDRVRDVCQEVLYTEGKEAFERTLASFGTCVDKRFRQLEAAITGHEPSILACTAKQMDVGLVSGSVPLRQEKLLLSQTATSKGCSEQAGRQPE